MEDALDGVWPTNSMWFGWGNATTGTQAYLKGIITDACAGLDENEQLLLYFDDHGDTHSDVDEFLKWALPYIFSELLTVDFLLHAAPNRG